MSAVSPIKDEKKIKLMKLVLRDQSKRGQGTRNLLLFVMGINTALRISDLLSLTVGDVRNEKGKIRDNVRLNEKKTGKVKEFYINDSVRAVLRETLRSDMDNSEPLFPSRKGGKAITSVQAYRILTAAAESIGLEKIGTHTLRKTFGYHIYKQTNNLGLVQKLLNHSSSGDTLRYIGLEQETLDDAYRRLNL